MGQLCVQDAEDGQGKAEPSRGFRAPSLLHLQLSAPQYERGLILCFCGCFFIRFLPVLTLIVLLNLRTLVFILVKIKAFQSVEKSIEFSEREALLWLVVGGTVPFVG